MLSHNYFQGHLFDPELRCMWSFMCFSHVCVSFLQTFWFTPYPFTSQTHYDKSIGYAKLPVCLCLCSCCPAMNLRLIQGCPSALWDRLWVHPEGKFHTEYEWYEWMNDVTIFCFYKCFLIKTKRDDLCITDYYCSKIIKMFRISATPPPSCVVWRESKGVAARLLLLYSLPGKEKKTFCVEGFNSRHLVADENRDFEEHYNSYIDARKSDRGCRASWW